MSVRQGLKYASANLALCFICYVLPFAGVVRNMQKGATNQAGIWLTVFSVGCVLYIVFCHILAHEIIEEYNG